MENYSLLVEKNRGLILDSFEFFWKNPETGFREWKTNSYLSDAFEALGYELIQAGDIPGFYTEIDTMRPGPTVLVMGEEDALLVADHPEADPKTGAVHACGHCAQISALLGVAAALKEPHALDDLSGKIRLMAVPAEELIEVEFRQSLREQGVIRSFGGKTELMRRGFMDGVDIAFMIHTQVGPLRGGRILRGSNGCIAKSVEYQGVAAHAGGYPEKGINALYAANLGLNAINSLRETFIDAAHIRVHPIITAGGDSVNNIPSSVKLESYVRAATIDQVVSVNEKVNRALAASAAAIGAKVQITDIPGYYPVKNDDGLIAVFKEAMEHELDWVECKPDGWSTGCSDVGDLSSVVPTIMPFITASSGNAHGANYQIVDPETACVTSAKVQLLALNLLLKDNAAKANEIISNFEPQFKSISDYFTFMDSLDKDFQAVSYQENGDVVLKCC